MTAVACLRVLLPENHAFADQDALANLVSKIGGAFLDVRWKWPRRWGVVAPFAFALADPRATKLDPRELQDLSAELQYKLFGERGAGEVCLMTLQGSQEDILRFAAAERPLLQEMIDKGGGAVFGHLNTITPTEITALVTLDSRPPFPDETPTLPTDPPSAAVLERAAAGMAAAARPRPAAVPAPSPIGTPRPPPPPPPSALSAAAPRPPLAAAEPLPALDLMADDREPESVDRGFRGIYHTAREIFVGGVVVARPDARIPLWSLVDGLRDMPAAHVQDHDLACLDVAQEVLDRPGGVIFVPINYSAVVHGSVRRAYESAIASLPISQRQRLAAVVYETPRDPSWTALTHLKTFLGPRFAFIDLQISDPGFSIDKLLEDGGVTSVTFALPEGEEKTRLLAARRFMASMEAFRRRRVWPGLTNVRTRRELAACITLKAPFLSGKAVSATLRAPPDAGRRSPASLPLRGEPLAARPVELALG